MVKKEEPALSRWSRLKYERRSRGGGSGEPDAAPNATPGATSGATPDAIWGGARAARSPGDAPLPPDPLSRDRPDSGPGSPGGREGRGVSGGDAEAIREEDLPDIDSLTYESDFTVFLRDGVPAALRQRALAALWRSDPVLANVDGLNDYDLDYTIKEFEQIARDSAEDLARGTKRESAHDRRRAARERARRTGGREAPQEAQAREAQSQPDAQGRDDAEADEVALAQRGMAQAVSRPHDARD